jgi:hypothetical protein
MINRAAGRAALNDDPFDIDGSPVSLTNPATDQVPRTDGKHVWGKYKGAGGLTTVANGPVQVKSIAEYGRAQNEA